MELGKVLFISGLDGDTRRYRCFHLQEQLALQQVETGFRERYDPQLLVDVLDYDIFILHRVPFSPLIDVVIDLAHLQGKPVVFETDDLVFDPELYDQIGFVDTLSPEEARQYHADLDRLAETFDRCDGVLTTTEFLAEQVRRRGKPAYVHRNAPSAEMLRISDQARAAQREQSAGDETGPDLVTLSYFSGTGSHNRDFMLVTEALIWALETYPQVRLHISGHLELSSAFSPFQTRIRRAPYVSWRELPHLIARCDVNLAPLEPDNPFCRAKSEIKFVEAALVGVPTIASHVEAYELAITDGEDGLVAASEAEWKAGLRALIEDPARREAMGEAARRTAYARYLPEQRAPQLVNILDEVWQTSGHAPAPPEQMLPQIAELLREYAKEMESQRLGQEAQLVSLRRMTTQYEREFEHKRAILNRRIEGLSGQVERLERHLEAIQQGRVMRLLNGLQRLLGRRKEP